MTEEEISKLRHIIARERYDNENRLRQEADSRERDNSDVSQALNEINKQLLKIDKFLRKTFLKEWESFEQ